MIKVLLATPLKQKPYIFTEFQKSIDNLIIPDGVTLDRFYIVNNCPEIIPYITSGSFQEITFEEQTLQQTPHNWKSEHIRHMIDMRNHCFNVASQGDYDYVFSVDSDLILNPHTLKLLLDYKTDIIGEAYWTKSEIGLWYNASLYNLYNMDQKVTVPNNIQAIVDHQVPGVYRVGMTGACILISKRVWQSGVNYSEIPYQWAEPISEDRNFCLRAACAGFPIYIDTQIPPYHLFNDEYYNTYMERIGSSLRAPTV